MAREPKASRRDGAAEAGWIRSGRADGRFATTAGWLHHRFRMLRPQLEFDPSMSARDFEAWKARVRRRLRQVLGIRPIPRQPAPRLVVDDARDGYRLQRWELYPEPDCVLPVVMLVPDGVSARCPAGAVMCLPGSDHPNELLAGEPPPAGVTWKFPEHNAMALHFVRKGLVSLCVENPGTGSLFDPRAPDWRRQCAEMIWMGSSYEGLSVVQKLAALRWLKTLPMVDRRRIGVCGHSLGAKPALLVGLLDPEVRAVVWNSGAYDWRLRHVATNMTPVAPWQYIPGFIRWFDYLDLKAALAPTPLLVSEGGRTDELRKVKRAYALAGAAGRFRVSYGPSCRSAAQRKLDRVPVPEALTGDEFCAYHNGSNAEHRFQADVVVPWMCRILRR